MPTFIVHTEGEKPRFATLDKTLITIGRDSMCDVVLPEQSVSRMHAQVKAADGHNWVVSPLAMGNPVLVNGRFIQDATALGEGAEIQIANSLVIFSLDVRARQAYLADVTHYEGVCSGCGWTGKLGARNRNPTCPRCGIVISERKDDLTGDAVKAMASQGETSYLDAAAVVKMGENLRAATKARLRRIDERREHKLSVDKAITIGKVPADVVVGGLWLGGSAAVTWNGQDAYTIQFSGLYCALSVNDHRTRSAVLKGGDKIKVGSAEFRLVLT